MILTINGQRHDVDVEDNMPLLWVLRDVLAMTGTKYGCGIGQCGCCTVIVDGQARRSCQTAASTVANAQITTIEGVRERDPNNAVLHAWIEEGVPQCGYCQPGMIMATTALLAKIPKPTDADINREVTNICRCGTYYELRSAIHRAAGTTAGTR